MNGAVDESREDVLTVRSVTFPLSKAQWGWWLAQQLQPNVPVTVAMYLDLVGPVDLELLTRCTQQATEEFESPRLRLCLVHDSPRQYVDSAAHLRWEPVDLTSQPDPIVAAVDRMRRDFSTPLDPLTDQLTVAAVFAVAPQRHLLYLRSHHIVLDGVGAAAVLRRTGELYRAAIAEHGVDPVPPAGGETPSRARGPLSISQILAEERTYLESSRAAADRDYWNSQLAGVEAPVSLAEGAASARADPYRLTATLDSTTARALADAQARYGATFPELVLASFACYLARMTGRSDITLTMPVTARPTAVLRGSAGSMSNVVPLRLRELDRTTVGEVIAQVRATVIGALRHQRHRHEDIRRDHPTLRDGFGPLVNVLGFTEPLRVGPLTGHVRLLALGPVADLHVNGYQVGPGADSVSIDFQANPARYRRETAVRQHRLFLDYFGRFLGAEKNCPTTSLDETYAVSMPASQTPMRTLPELLRAAVAHGDVAVCDRGRALTYRELDETSSRWAHLLLDRGVGPAMFVVVAIPRSLESVLALWAVAKSGACFVPVDPDDPAARIAAIATGCRARIGLTVTSVRAELPGRSGANVAHHAADGADDIMIEWLALDDPAQAQHYPGTPITDTDRPRPLRLEHPAYVIHTSGTTGPPKGVVVGHRGLGDLTDYLVKHYAINRNSVLLHSHTAVFDAHLLELLATFAAGARVVVAPPSVSAGGELARLIHDSGCTIVQTAPAVLATLSPDQVPGVEVVAIGGEACSAALAAVWAPHVRLFNGYGPAEATVMVTETAAMTAGDPISIGAPLPGVLALVLDTRLRQAPVTAKGELYLGGRCVADGYLNDPGATAARFVADPFGVGERLYRTGDLVSVGPGGTFEFFGRLDGQLELHGRRIERAEVESALLAAPDIAYAVVTVAGAGTPGARLVGYVVAAPGAHLDTKATLAALRTALPPALVPTTLLELDRLPLSGNGKVDRAALPSPRTRAHPLRPPQTELQRLITERIAAALGAECVGLDDDFFELGGNSLLGVSVSAELAAATGVPVTVAWLYTTPTVADLADRITGYDGDAGDDGLGIVLTLRRNGSRAPLFCVHSAVPLAWCYAGLATYITDRPVYGLQATQLTADSGTPTIDDLVDSYLDAIVDIQPHGPYNLVGWSLGGQLAHAIAGRLQARGGTVSVLAMLDSVVFPPETPPPPAPRMRDLLTHLLGDEPDDADEAPELTSAEAADELATGKPSFGTGLTAGQLERLHRGYVTGVALSHSYRPHTFRGDLLYFSATRGVTAPFGADIWRPYVTGELIEQPVDATHAQLTNTSVVAQIGPVLARHLTNTPARSPDAGEQLTG